MNNTKMQPNNTQFVLSYELLYLLRWLVDNDIEKLKKLITKALASGLDHELQKMRSKQSQETEDMHYSILEFFNVMEGLMIESMNEKTVQRAVEKNLMTAIDQIDSAICDDATLRTSVEKATAKSEHNPKENPKELLFKELLKRWKPHDKNILN